MLKKATFNVLSAAKPRRTASNLIGSRSYSQTHPCCSSKSPPASAAVLPAQSTSNTKPAAPSTERIPQPFIPKPLSRKHQISSLAKCPTNANSTTIQLTGPTSHSITLPNLFLRDSSHHPAHLHPASRQKLFRTSDVPLRSSVVGYGVHEVGGEDTLVMEWSEGVEGVDKLSAKLSLHPVSFLLELARSNGTEGVEIPSVESWNQEELLPRLFKTSCSKYMSKESELRSTLTSLLEDGIVFLEDVSTAIKGGHETELKKVVERIGSIRKTWYGDLWDVRAEEGSKNIAYTNLDLGLHMDLTHFESPPRYQFLHSLQNGSISGGLSYFVDAYYIASHLRLHHPEAYHTLCTIPVVFEYQNGGHHTRFVRPTFEVDAEGELLAVNYSPPFQGPLLLSSTSTGTATPYTPDPSISSVETPPQTSLESLHDALGLFASLCSLPANQFHIQLQPGDCVIFDNRRVLHARTSFAFTDEVTPEGERGRWLKGAYMDGDEVRSKWRVLEGKKREGKLL